MIDSAILDDWATALEDVASPPFDEDDAEDLQLLAAKIRRAWVDAVQSESRRSEA